MSGNRIVHQGVIDQIVGSTAMVRIVQQPGCEGCAAASLCQGSNGGKVKQIEVQISANDHRWSIGQEVQLVASMQVAYRSIFYSFVLPLLLFLAVLAIGGAWLRLPETISGTIGLCVIPLYFLVLRLFNGVLRRTLRFSLYPINTTLLR